MNNLLSQKVNDVIRIIDIPETDYNVNGYKIVDEKTIKYIERVVRRSYEYKDFINHFKTKLDISSCTFYEGYSLANGLSVEIHHSPFTLYEYVETVCRKHLELNKGWYDPLDVAEEVTKLHFNFHVGLVPLNPTAHELVHSDNLEIHPDLVLGAWEVFVEEYSKWIPESIQNKIEHLKIIKKENSDKIPNILKPKKLLLETPFKHIDKKFITGIVEEKIKNIGLN